MACIRGDDLSPAQILSLLCLCITGPDQQGTRVAWGVSHAPDSGYLSDVARLTIFDQGLQLVVQDLLRGSNKVRGRAGRSNGAC